MPAVNSADYLYVRAPVSRLEGRYSRSDLSHTITEPCCTQPVMLKRSYYESLGILVNAVLLRVLVDIENREDISEEASHRLNELCQMLHDVEKLFMEDEEVGCSLPKMEVKLTKTVQSTVALHVPVWFKFKFLSELLEASMVGTAASQIR